MYNVHVFREKTEKWDPDQLGTTCEFNDSVAVLRHLTSWTQTCFVEQITCMSEFYDDISQMAKLRTLNSALTLGIELGRSFRKAGLLCVLFQLY